MSLLFTKQPLVVNPDLACLVGLNEAIVLQQVYYWIKKSEHQIDGRTWVYNSMVGWHEQFPFLSYDTVKRAFKKLEDTGLLVSGNYNKSKIDRTKWYSIDENKLDDLAQCIGANCTNGVGHSALMDQGNLHQPIPETTRDYTETSKKINKKGSRLPDDWKLSEENARFAADRDFDKQETLDMALGFKNYWQSKAGASATKLDWDKTWQNWVLNTFNKPKSKSTKQTTKADQLAAANRSIFGKKKGASDDFIDGNCQRI